MSLKCVAYSIIKNEKKKTKLKIIVRMNLPNLCARRLGFLASCNQGLNKESLCAPARSSAGLNAGGRLGMCPGRVAGKAPANIGWFSARPIDSKPPAIYCGFSYIALMFISCDGLSMLCGGVDGGVILQVLAGDVLSPLSVLMRESMLNA